MEKQVAVATTRRAMLSTKVAGWFGADAPVVRGAIFLTIYIARLVDAEWVGRIRFIAFY
jgi:hypothetical protein